MKTLIGIIFPKEKAMKTVSPALTPMQDQQLGEIDGPCHPGKDFIIVSFVKR